MTARTTRVACAACGASGSTLEPFPFRCPNAGRDDGDHVMTRTLEADLVEWPADDDPNPFVRYRTLFHSYDLARSRGVLDGEYVALVRALDEQVARVEGHGFAITPFGRIAELSRRLGFGEKGGVWVKDETGNVSGSHKARHLMGLSILLEVADRLEERSGGEREVGRQTLAIASCGNAALAAAVLARAARRPLEVFVPTWADRPVVERLAALGARVTECPRDGVAGDPTYRGLHSAIAHGALPFTCQGSDNGLTIEGGETLSYEMVSQLSKEGVAIDRLFLQVGGGALASACVQGFREAVELGALPRSPAFHGVQTMRAHPLKRAFDRVAQRIDAGSSPAEALRYAATHRSEFMWPWEEEPKSIAHGILDDETYDWLAVARGVLESGGGVGTVSEEMLEEANELARETTGIAVDHTGSSGLAGLLEQKRAGLVTPDERVAVLFTGIRR